MSLSKRINPQIESPFLQLIHCASGIFRFHQQVAVRYIWHEIKLEAHLQLLCALVARAKAKAKAKHISTCLSCSARASTPNAKRKFLFDECEYFMRLWTSPLPVYFRVKCMHLLIVFATLCANRLSSLAVAKPSKKMQKHEIKIQLRALLLETVHHENARKLDLAAPHIGSITILQSLKSMPRANSEYLLHCFVNRKFLLFICHAQMVKYWFTVGWLKWLKREQKSQQSTTSSCWIYREMCAKIERKPFWCIDESAEPSTWATWDNSVIIELSAFAFESAQSLCAVRLSARA